MSQLDLRATPLAWRSVVSVLLFVAFWEIAARSHVAPAILLPPFSVVAEQLWHSTLDGTLVADLSLSLGRAICGLFLATVGGVFLGLLMARNRAIEWLADPLVALGFPSPKIAFLPIFLHLVVRDRKPFEDFACRLCLHIPGHHRHLQCRPRRKQAVCLVGPLAR
jgi:ABC-type nitrate/sulfonate/bicarbonate transport system permease component